MKKLSYKYPEFFWNENSGYGTKLHIDKIDILKGELNRDIIDFQNDLVLKRLLLLTFLFGYYNFGVVQASLEVLLFCKLV